MSNPSITPDAAQWWQRDTGRTVTVAGGTMTECHFANRKQGSAYVQAVINGVARVPDELLQVAAPIKAYGYVSDGAGGQTYIEQVFEVTARNIPADYTYTKTAQKTIRDAEKARDQAFAAVDHVHDVADQVVGFRNDAKASADAAKKSADSAEYQKGEAKKYADDAGVAFANAQSQAKMSSVYATESENSAKKSEASATKAAQSASEASASASEAATSAQEAKAAAGNAASEVLAATKANADAAAQSATDAATAKAGAETAASNAATSAGAAADSAAAAAKSAGDAAASVDAINVIAPKTVSTGASYEGTGVNGIAIGSNAEARNDAVSLGYRAKTFGQQNTGVGRDTLVEGYKNTALGYNTNVSSHDAIAIGADSVASKAFEFSVGKPAIDSADELTREITHVSTPTAPTSASTKKYTDDNDSKTLTEAKKYTDDNTTNALIGKVSGKLLHVEDAWPSPLLNVTIDGAYKQDGTPSPENPVPITVIENPVLTMTGRNVFMLSSNLMEKVSNGITFTPKGDGGFHISGTATDVAFYNLDFVNATRSITSFIGQRVFYNVPNMTLGYLTSDDRQRALKSGDVVPAEADTWRSFFSVTKGSTIDKTIYPYVTISKDAGYAPYISNIIAITLPAEHPYLAALSNNIHDEIMIDKDGNASLVARTQKVDVSNLPAPSAITQLNNGMSRYQYRSVIHTPAMNDTAAFAPAFPSVIDYSFPRQGMYVSNTSILLGAAADPTEALKAGGYIYTSLATPMTYSLGKLDIPALPETISNVWTDAELTTNMSMTYKQDVNTVIAGLIAQINALKGTTDEPPEVAEPTIE